VSGGLEDVPSGVGTPSAPSVPNDDMEKGTSPARVSLPAGAGKVQGMGESFSAELSTGVGGYSVPIALPAGRGGVQASLSLAYSSSRGYGNAGLGWSLGVPFIARQTDRGIPGYQDGTGWTPQQDRFVFGGGQELVPICLVTGGGCAGAASGETMPAWASGWQYFRPRVEGGFQRFFWSPDHRTWRVQSKSGVVIELGASLDAFGDTSSLETDTTGTKVFRWNAVRTYDANVDGSGSAVNVVQYRYCGSGAGASPCEAGTNAVYLTDVYDTPQAGSATAPLSAYAHHARIHYERRSDTRLSFSRGWAVLEDQRINHVDVTSKPFSGGSQFELLRRYWLTYGEPGIALHPSLLYSVTMEGRCASPIDESASGDLPASTGCPELPSITFGYQHVTPYALSAGPGTADIPLFEGFDERLLTMASSPTESLQAGHTELLDVNADGLPDVLTTDVANHGGKHGLYLNGFGGAASTFTKAQPMDVVSGEPGVDPSVLGFHNPNVSSQDVDGDGIMDLLHMPRVKQYAVYTAQGSALAWNWVGRPVTTAASQDPKIDFQSNERQMREMDVNGDGLVDVVYSAGDAYQTFFSLGRYPGGDGQFGYATWTGPASASIDDAPVVACVPWSATPVRFGDPDVIVADMNADGLPDVVRVRPGDVRYWPGRGDGTWGTGSGCRPGTTTSYEENQHIAMTQSPEYVQAGAQVRVSDVNGDGFPDLVVLHPGTIELWLNVDGQGWTTAHHTIAGTPYLKAIGSALQMADMNGSGTADMVWGNGGNYQYMDILGGQQPWTLVTVSNGLGKTTTIQYASSTQMMLQAATAGNAWASTAPTPVQVVTQMTVTDNLNQVGRPLGQYVTRYTYRDAVYEGRQREFRGFRTASTTVVGDTNSPTSTTEQRFLLGECVDETPNDGIDDCALSQRWRDNPREALKGLAVVSEAHDGGTSLAAGTCAGCTYASTAHTTWHLKQLYEGSDGRVVRYAYPSQSDTYTYETSPFTAAATAASPTPMDVECEWSATLDVTSPLTLRGTSYAHTRSQTPSVDAFGNRLHTTALGCVDGAACTGADEVLDSFVTYALPPGDTSGWSWRPVYAYATGSAHSGNYGEHSSSYDSLGRSTSTSTAALSGTQPLARFHQIGGAAVAPPPANASQDGNVATSTTTYDLYGNATKTTGPDGRCASAVFDASYAQLPVVHVSYAGPPGSGGCGSTQLVLTASFDRGFSLATYTQDPLLEPAMTVLDGFGRVAQVFGAHPTTPQTLAPVPQGTVSFTLGSPYSTVVTQVQNGADATVPQYATSTSFVDGLGRTLVSFSPSDPSAGDGGNWIVSPSPLYDAKGAVQVAFLPLFYSGSPNVNAVRNVAMNGSQAHYDAFGRTIATTARNGDPTQTVYHPMSTERWDAEDLKVGGPHYGTFASSAVDGHGRTIQTTERIRANGALELHNVLTRYSPTGQPEVLTRTTSTGAVPVVRTMTYDSWGRLVLNADTAATWRYAYDDAGDLVGTSDARGCGKNVFYDTAGRELAEDYSPCLATHPPYTPPNLATGDGTEIYNVYDTQDPDAQSAVCAGAVSPCPWSQPLPMYLGRLASISDRGAKMIPSYDYLGRVVQEAKKVAGPGAPASTLASRYASHWWVKSAWYDAADRIVSATTGAEQILGTGGSSIVSTTYSARGLPTTIAGAYGTLVAGSVVDADGRPLGVTYGDSAATSTSRQYDAKRRLVSACTAPAAATGCPTGSTSGSGQGTLSYFTVGYDGADNPLAIADTRNPAEWTAGAMPVSRSMQYDDLYRLTSVTYGYPGGPDSWTDPFAFEDGGGTAPRLAEPSPHVSYAKRVGQQTYAYDWLGNSTSSGDDANGFYDRSLGTIVNGGASPYQLTSASNESLGGGTTGHLGATYDAIGDLVSMAVVREGPCLPSTASCNQRFVYDWDEAGGMARARRWDGDTSLATDPVPAAVPAADLSFTYGAGGRVLKLATDAQGNMRATVYVFSGVELRRAQYFAGTNDYEHTTSTEVVDLGLARLSYQPNAPSPSNDALHVLLRVGDSLGSSSVLVDKETGKLAEARTYFPYGETESDYRPASFAGERDDVAFTGKEEDVELGIQYFGARYLVPALGRWASADPLATHGLGSDLNEYAYVSGRAFAATDPTGLDKDFQAISDEYATADTEASLKAFWGEKNVWHVEAGDDHEGGWWVRSADDGSSLIGSQPRMGTTVDPGRPADRGMPEARARTEAEQEKDFEHAMGWDAPWYRLAGRFLRTNIPLLGDFGGQVWDLGEGIANYNTRTYSYIKDGDVRTVRVKSDPGEILVPAGNIALTLLPAMAEARLATPRLTPDMEARLGAAPPGFQGPGYVCAPGACAFDNVGGMSSTPKTGAAVAAAAGVPQGELNPAQIAIMINASGEGPGTMEMFWSKQAAMAAVQKAPVGSRFVLGANGLPNTSVPPGTPPTYLFEPHVVGAERTPSGVIFPDFSAGGAPKRFPNVQGSEYYLYPLF
jgi:RHS repeat-associated protein